MNSVIRCGGLVLGIWIGLFSSASATHTPGDWRTYQFDASRRGANALDRVRLPWELQVESGLHPPVAGLAGPLVDRRRLYTATPDGRVRAMDLQDGVGAWEQATPGSLHSTPVMDDGVLYVGGVDGVVRALEKGSGVEIWRRDMGASSFAPLLQVNETVYVALQDGTLTALARHDGRTFWRTELGDYLIGGPAGDGDRVYVTLLHGELVAVEGTTGGVLWRRALAGPCRTAPVLAGELVLVGDGGGQVTAWDRGGVSRWAQALGEPVLGGLAVLGGTIYTMTKNGTLVALALSDGATAWQRSLSEPVRTAPAVLNGSLVQVTGTHVVALDPRTGEVQSRHPIGGPAPAPVAVSRGRVVVLTGGGQALVLASKNQAPEVPKDLQVNSEVAPIIGPKPARFSWVPVDPDGDDEATGFRIQVVADAAKDFLQPLVDTGLVDSAESQTLLALSLLDGFYRWRVQTQDLFDAVGPFSDGPARFAVDRTPPRTVATIGNPQFRHAPDDHRVVSSKTLLTFEAEDPVVNSVASGVAGTLVRFHPENGETTGTFQPVRDKIHLAGPDGFYVIEFFSEDRVGNREGVQSVRVELDNTPPEVAWLVPDQADVGVCRYVTERVHLMGTARDVHFAEYEVRLAAGEGAPLVFARLVGPVSDPVVEGTLGEWEPAVQTPGPYTLQLTASDQVGNRGEAVVTVVVGPPTIVGEVSGLHHPADIALDRSGRLLIADRNADVVRRVTLAGESTVIGNGVLLKPGGVLGLADGRIVVSDTNHDTVRTFGEAGELLETTADRAFNKPAGLVQSRDGFLWVADRNRDVVRRINSQGFLAGTLGDGILNKPEDVATFPNGDLVVADRNGDAVRRFRPDGTLVETRTGFNKPEGVAIGPRGDLWVSDTNHDRVVRYDRFGRRYLTISAAAQDDPLNKPKGLALDADCRLYVADSNRSRVLIFGSGPLLGAIAVTSVPRERGEQDRHSRKSQVSDGHDDECHARAKNNGIHEKERGGGAHGRSNRMDGASRHGKPGKLPDAPGWTRHRDWAEERGHGQAKHRRSAREDDLARELGAPWLKANGHHGNGSTTGPGKGWVSAKWTTAGFEDPNERDQRWKRAEFRQAAKASIPYVYSEVRDSQTGALIWNSLSGNPSPTLVKTEHGDGATQPAADENGGSAGTPTGKDKKSDEPPGRVKKQDEPPGLGKKTNLTSTDPQPESSGHGQNPPGQPKEPPAVPGKPENQHQPQGQQKKK